MSGICEVAPRRRTVQALQGRRRAARAGPRLEVLEEDWEAAFIEKCPRCFMALLADDQADDSWSQPQD
jgi:hypothetical protein